MLGDTYGIRTVGDYKTHWREMMSQRVGGFIVHWRELILYKH